MYIKIYIVRLILIIMLNIEKIKQELQEEYTKGNKKPYRELLAICMRIYRFENKDKVSLYNIEHYKKVKINLNKKKKQEQINTEVKPISSIFH